jgi:hypothetical protein
MEENEEISLDDYKFDKKDDDYEYDQKDSVQSKNPILSPSPNLNK